MGESDIPFSDGEEKSAINFPFSLKKQIKKGMKTILSLSSYFHSLKLILLLHFTNM